MFLSTGQKYIWVSQKNTSLKTNYKMDNDAKFIKEYKSYKINYKSQFNSSL